MFGWFDSYYMLLVVPALLLAMWAQGNVQSTYGKYQRVRSRSGMSGSDVARMILDRNGLNDVRIEQINGHLTDHYDPRDRVVRLSQSVYGNTSIAAIGVAAHEVGHAVQHATGYAALELRNAVIPISSFGAKLSMPLILLGILMSSDLLVQWGILAFALVTLFQLITLPVEFNASNRAMNTLTADGILQGEEIVGTRRVLKAAALTYVAALIVSAMQLLRLILIFRNNRD